MRHGDAVSGGPGVDADRSLSPLGERQAETMGRMLAEVIAATRQVLASPYTRARQTAERLLRAAGYDAGYRLEPQLAPGGSAVLLAESIDRLGAPRVWLVSHMPLVGALVDWLVDGTGHVVTRFDPADVVCLEAECWQPGCARIAWRRQYRDYLA